MKKIAIAGASVALAAMPVVGVFAESAQYTSITDKITLTVEKTCQMEADPPATTGTNPNVYGTNVTLGSHTAPYAYAAAAGTAMTITCNAIAGWHLAADATALSSTTTASTISFGDYQTSTSIWSAGVALSGNNTENAAITTGWAITGDNAFKPGTGGSTVVSDVEDSNNKAKPVSGLTITPSYKAYTQSDQAEATYSGTITYTFVDDTPVNP